MSKRFYVRDNEYTPKDSYSSYDYFTIYDLGQDDDDYSDGDVKNKKRRHITFSKRLHAECFAAALNLGWESLKRRGEENVE